MNERPSFAAQSESNERAITLGLLNAIQGDNKFTQRSVAKDLGIALGLANAYLKRCVKKGYVKLSKIPPNRYAYYLTPTGFAEKSRLTSEFLSQSFRFFREARDQYTEIMASCTDRGWRRVAFCGDGDLAEIASLCNKDFPIEIVGIIAGADEDAEASSQGIATALAELGDIDAVVITELKTPQVTFNALTTAIPVMRILMPDMLDIARSMPAFVEQDSHE